MPQNTQRPNRRKALVLGDDTRSFLSVVRSLGRAGIEVHIAWHDRDRVEGAVAARSRYVARKHLLPLYEEHSPQWKLALIDLMQRERFDLVIPCSDPCLIPLQKHRAELEPFGQIYLLDDAIYPTVFDKFRMTELARSVGVNTPAEMIVNGPEDVRQVRSSFNLPVVLKPRSSFSEADLSARHSVKKAYSWEEFDRLIARLSAAGPVAIQENFIGVGVGVELLLSNGEPLMVFQHVRLHEPLHGGGSSYRQGVAVDERLLDAALSLLRPMRYTGVAMVEFKMNRQTRDWVFIEVNGRFWGSLPLAIASGANFPAALFMLLVDGRTDFSRSYRQGLCSRHWSYDLNWQLANLKADHSDPTLASLPLSRVAAETFINLVTLRERSDTFAVDDPMPAAAEAGRLVNRFTGGIRSKLRPIVMRLPVSRVYLRRQAIKAVRKARTVLFVCKGNICRSPFAAAVAGSSTDKIVTSAGYLGPECRQSPENAVMAAASCGIDLSGHRSQLLSEQKLREADVILVFDLLNYNHLAANYPEVMPRVHFLGALRSELPLFIADPWGSDLQAYSRTYEQISLAVKSAVGAH